MQPQELRPEDFSHYPPQARALAIANLSVLRQVPLALLPVLLRQIIDYDWQFALEQRLLLRQFDYLRSLHPDTLSAMMAPFASIRLSRDMYAIDWVNLPQRFDEALSTMLWSTQQMESYRKAASQYQLHLENGMPKTRPVVPRFTVVVIGCGVASSKRTLFRPLRPHGVLFTGVQPTEGLETLIAFINRRARNYPEPDAHWYIDGGKPEPECGPEQGVTLTSYFTLAPVALRELNLMHHFVQESGRKKSVGPEAVQSFMAALKPKDLGIQENPSNAALRHFEVDVLTLGAGTQVFSTTFVQWTAREALRRAQPLSMLARFAPRQRMAPMNDLLRRNPLTQPTDPSGSLIDADMGAYYTWINQARLPGADESRFLAWFEDHNTAIAVAPGLPHGTMSESPVTLNKILDWMS